jgi:hypothetical protein
VENSHSIDASNFNPHMPIEKVSFIGVNSFYCFMVSDTGDLLGYADSWVLGTAVNLTTRKRRLKRQPMLAAKQKAGAAMHTCEECGELYVHHHTCRAVKKSRKVNSAKTGKKSQDTMKEANETEDSSSDEMRTSPQLDSSLLNSLGEKNAWKIDVYHNDGLWYCGTMRQMFEKTCLVDFFDGDEGSRVSYRDIIDCVHVPQQKIGHDLGKPDYLQRTDEKS